MTLEAARWVRLDPSSDRRYPLPLWQRDDETLFASDRLRIGLFAAAPSDPRFRFSGVCTAPLIAFPRTSFLLQPMGRAARVADPMVALLYEPDRVYYRFALDEAEAAEGGASSARGTTTDTTSGAVPPLRARSLAIAGDTSLWFEPQPARSRECPPGDGAAPCEPSAAVWPRLLAPIDAATYLLQDQLGRYLETCHTAPNAPRVDRPLVEGAAALLVARALRGAARQLPDGGPSRGGRAHERETAAAEAFRRHLARQGTSDVSVRQAVERAAVSKTHVNRVLRAHLGWSPHRYGLELRLRRALVRWGAADTEASETLADLARELGFSSHSHLTARFRQVFGVVPSWLREGTAEERLRWLSGGHAQPAGSDSAQE